MEIVDDKNRTYKIHPDFQYDVDKHITKGNYDKIDKLISNAPVTTGAKKSVSELYEEKTGKSWDTAKKEGLTDGSYTSNMKLRYKLLTDSKPTESSSTTEPNKDLSKATTFKEAFSIARNELGANKLFEWDGKVYGTNVAGEKFTPDDEELDKFKLNTDTVKTNLSYQNKLVESPYTSKEVVKLNTGYKNWESIKKRNQEINKMEDVEKINSFHSGSDDKYLIVDKKASRMHLYQRGKLIDSFEVGTGANPGDAQTVTKYVDRDGDGKITDADKPYKTDWSAGNKSTGAGIYTISKVDPSSKEYYGLPSFNMLNESGQEVSTSIHGTPMSRRGKFDNGNLEDNRMSNGCINGKCTDLKKLYNEHGITSGTKVYILPEEEGNRMVYQDGKIIMKSNAVNRQNSLNYVDSKNNNQKGQGTNYSTKTLEYKPIKVYINKTEFEKKVYQALDTDDDKEYESTTKPFILSLKDNKQAVMKAAKISSDTYNDIAMITFGIYGTETNFGDTHNAVGNFVRAVNKYTDPKSSSSPDYKSKATTYKANSENNSVGLTQIRFSYLNDDEKKALSQVGITSNEDFMNPTKAAMGTAIVLGVRYNQQLTDAQKQNIYETLPTKWNTRSNYSQRVKANSKYLSITQQD